MIIINVRGYNHHLRDIYTYMLQDAFLKNTTSECFWIDMHRYVDDYLNVIKIPFSSAFQYFYKQTNVNLNENDNFVKFKAFLKTLDIDKVHLITTSFDHDNYVLITINASDDEIIKINNTGNVIYNINIFKGKLNFPPTFEYDFQIPTSLTDDYDETISIFEEAISIFLTDLHRKGQIKKNDSSNNSLYSFK